MELSTTSYLYGLGEISPTFVDFSATIMVFRQTAGNNLSSLDCWITLMFIQLGFLVTARSLSASLRTVRGMPSSVVWRFRGIIVGAILAVFTASYRCRRQKVSATRAPVFVWIEMLLLSSCTIVLIGNAGGRPFFPNSASFCVGWTGILFIAGFGLLYALGRLHRETERSTGNAGTLS